MISRIFRIALLLVSCLFAGAVGAQAWPSAKPIRIVIAFGPGSASDIFARLIGDQIAGMNRSDLAHRGVADARS